MPSALKLKAALADTEDALREYAELEGKAEDEIDPEDALVKELTSHGRHKNLSFFAFTATPKAVSYTHLPPIRQCWIPTKR